MSTVDLLKRGNGRYRVEAVTANRNAAQLAQIARELECALCGRRRSVGLCRTQGRAWPAPASRRRAARPPLIEAAERPADWVMAAVSGAVGLEAHARRGQARRDRRARQQGMPGLRRRAVHAHGRGAGATVLPVNSEHNAIFQALTAGPREDVSRIILTASGGPFRTWTLRSDARGHARAGAQASELVDGPQDHHQFRDHDEQGAGTDRGASSVRRRAGGLDVLVHPQSIIHGMVEYRDGSVVAQLGSPDMRIPIAHCLAWPTRIEGRRRSSTWPRSAR